MQAYFDTDFVQDVNIAYYAVGYSILIMLCSSQIEELSFISLPRNGFQECYPTGIFYFVFFVATNNSRKTTVQKQACCRFVTLRSIAAAFFISYSSSY